MGADLDVGRRQAVRGRRRTGRELGVARDRRRRGRARRRAPSSRGAARRRGGRWRHRRARAGQVEPAVEDRKPGRQRLARVSQARRQRERQAAARRVAGDHDRLRIDPRGEQLPVGGEGVLERRRMLVLRPEAVVEQVDGAPPASAICAARPRWVRREPTRRRRRAGRGSPATDRRPPAARSGRMGHRRANPWSIEIPWDAGDPRPPPPSRRAAPGPGSRCAGRSAAAGASAACASGRGRYRFTGRENRVRACPPTRPST